MSSPFATGRTTQSNPLGYTNPGQADALCRQAADQLQRGGSTADAAAQFSEALRLDPRCARALNGMGFLAATEYGDLEEAHRLYTLAIEAQPHFSGAHHNLGELLLLPGALNDVDRAIEELTMAVGADPNLAVAHRSLAKAWLTRLEAGEAQRDDRPVAFHSDDEIVMHAENHFRLACELDSSDVADRVQLATLVFRRDPDEAETLLRQALALEPRAPRARALLGRILYETRAEHDAAEPLLRAAAREESSDATVNLALAVFLDDVRGRHEEAHAYYTRVLHLAPSEPTALLKDGVLLARHLGQPQRAEAVLRKALDLSPKSSAAHFWLGSVLQHAQRDFDEAEFRYRRAIACDPANVDALVALGVVLHTVRHHIAGARSCFERALGVDPTCKAAASNLASVLAVLQRKVAEADDQYALSDIVARGRQTAEAKQTWFVRSPTKRAEASPAGGVAETPLGM
jgi:tetratricopeptide (TPR) repeat protein